MDTSSITQPPIPPATPVPTPEPVKYRQLPLLATILSLLVLSIISALAYQNFILRKQISSITPIPPITPISPISSTSTPDPTADWKTYTNEKYKYSFKYPPEWIVSSVQGGIATETTDNANFRKASDQTPGESGFSIMVNTNSSLLISQVCDRGSQNDILCGSNPKYSSKTINGLTWESLEKGSAAYPPTGDIVYDMLSNGKLFIVYNWIAEQKDIDQILSTFRFLN